MSETSIEGFWNPNTSSVQLIVTSLTRPGSPVEGQQIYETDTNKVLWYDGTQWVEKGGGDLEALHWMSI